VARTNAARRRDTARDLFQAKLDAANAGAPGRLGLHASSVHANDVTVETAGNMALFWGRAYLPAALPAGVSLSEIK
jgi:hypothetical protein